MPKSAAAASRPAADKTSQAEPGEDAAQSAGSDAMVRAGQIGLCGAGPGIRFTLPIMQHAHLRIGDPVEVIVRPFEVLIRRQRPRLRLDELVARFDPGKHQRGLLLDLHSIGRETR